MSIENLISDYEAKIKKKRAVLRDHMFGKKSDKSDMELVLFELEIHIIEDVLTDLHKLTT